MSTTYYVRPHPLNDDDPTYEYPTDESARGSARVLAESERREWVVVRQTGRLSRIVYRTARR